MARTKKIPWHADGLRFECACCGACCGGEEGHIWVTDADIERMAKLADMPVEEFRARHVKDAGARKSLKEKPDGDCVMYEKGCRVYDVRPAQCASWPFWLGNLESEETWRETAARCPGVGKGRTYSCEEIRRVATAHGYARAH
jgi:hypothetical protein